MKLLRYGPVGQEKPGILDAQGDIHDLSSVLEDIGPETLCDKTMAKLRDLDLATLPIGPWLVTRDEVADPQDLPMYLEVNGHRYQDGSTKTMHFNVATVISHLSHFMSLQPGDVISTGTPPGVGMGQTPETYLKPGDRMELGIAGLGVQTQDVVAG